MVEPGDQAPRSSANALEDGADAIPDQVTSTSGPEGRGSAVHDWLRGAQMADLEVDPSRVDGRESSHSVAHLTFSSDGGAEEKNESLDWGRRGEIPTSDGRACLARRLP